jgi:hypothetical protein
LGVGLTTPHRKKEACYESKEEASDLDGFLGQTTLAENGHEILYMEYQKHV